MTLLRSHCFLPSPQIQKGNFPYWLSVSQMPMTVHWHSEQWTQWTNQWRHRTYLTWMEKYFHCKYHHLLKKERKRNWLLKKSTIYIKRHSFTLSSILIHLLWQICTFEGTAVEWQLTYLFLESLCSLVTRATGSHSTSHPGAGSSP